VANRGGEMVEELKEKEGSNFAVEKEVGKWFYL
jgi:hypothetical protein